MFRRSEDVDLSLALVILTTAYRPRSTVVPQDGVRTTDESDFSYDLT